MWPGQTRLKVRVPPMTIFFCFFFYFLVCKASSILSHSQFPRNPAKLRHESVKYRDYLFFVQIPEGSIASRLRPHKSLHNYCSYIFEKPNRPRCAYLEAFCGFWPKSSKLTSPKWAPKTTKFALWALELFTLKLCFLHLFHLFAFCWHTGDNVRLSDVVKFTMP